MNVRRRETYSMLRGLSAGNDRRLAKLKRQEQAKKNERYFGIAKHLSCKADKNFLSYKRLRHASKSHRFVPNLTGARSLAFQGSLDFQGFRNIGNSCYMNAVIRSLLSLAPLVEELKRSERLLTCGRTPRPAFYLSIMAVVRQLEKSQHGVISLAEVKEAIAKNAKRFASYTQEDAHEFLVSSLSLLEDEVLAFKKGDQPEPSAVQEDTDTTNTLVDTDTKQLFEEDKPLIEPEEKNPTHESLDATNTTSVNTISVTTTTSTTSVSAGLADQQVETQQAGDPKPDLSPEEIEALECPVATCFDCIVEVTIICKYCKQKSIIEELYRDFSLDIPHSSKSDTAPASLKDLFSNWFRAEEVTSLCEKCSHSEAIQKRRFKRLPLILTLHLKRFTHTINSSSEYIVNKVFEYVPINKKLYIGNVHVEYLPEDGEEFDKIVQELEEKRQASLSQVVESTTSQTATSSQETGEPSTIAENASGGVKEDSGVEPGINKRTRAEEDPKSDEQPEPTDKQESTNTEELPASKRARPNDSEPGITGEPTDHKGTEKVKETEDLTRQVSEKKGREKKRDKGKEKEIDTASNDHLALANFCSSHPVLFNFDEPTKSEGFSFKCEKLDMPPPPDLLTQMQRNPFQTSLYGVSSSITRPSISSITNFSTEDDELAKALAASRESFELEQALKASELDYFKQAEGELPPEIAKQISGPAPPIPIEEESGEGLEALAVYNLRSVLSHKGFGTGEGHYITDVLEEAQWKCYNDAIVKKIKEKKALGKTRQRNGYLFFYVQQQQNT